MAGAFITLEELAAFLSPRAPRDLTDDVLAALAIEAACGACRTISEQELDWVADDTVAFETTGSTRDLILPQLPAFIDEVRVNGEVEIDWRLMGSGILRREIAALSLPLSGGWPRGTVEVDYAHGHDPIPAELRMLALTLAARAYQQGIARQESTGSSSITYSVAAHLDLSSGERALLDKYRHPKAAVVAQVAAVS